MKLRQLDKNVAVVLPDGRMVHVNSAGAGAVDRGFDKYYIKSDRIAFMNNRFLIRVTIMNDGSIVVVNK
ncbi:MAG: hypothetical protein P0116_15945 [Candidatus Nitrosocosmicus sp.]|nr:hypothetical protein [Candidatus Nitrosocosmicus sp.]